MKTLSQEEISQLAESALTAYEVSADWNAAKREIIENCIEWHWFKPSKPLVLLCVKVAQMGWNELTLRVKSEIEA